MSENTKIVKGISKLENIGKKGKLSKLIKITIEHFEYLKSSLNDFSLKIMAYIIKGFFLAIKKSYETFSRDLEEFIELNIKGISRQKKEKIEKKEEKGELFTLQNFSLLSANTEFERFVNDTNMSQKINHTLKKINKKFSSIDFSSMTEELKREYLKKNFIQPLSDSLPSGSDFFSNSNLEQCISVDEDFANYIQFDLKAITGDLLLKKGDTNILPLPSELDFNKNPSDLPDFNHFKEFNFDKIVFNNVSTKNSEFKADSRVEFNIDKYIDKVYSEDLKAKDYNSPLNALQRHFKAILLSENLSKFKHSLIMNDKETNLFFNQRDKLVMSRYELSVPKDKPMRLIEGSEKFRGSQMFDNFQIKDSFNSATQISPKENIKVFEELKKITTIKHIFESDTTLLDWNLTFNKGKEEAQEIHAKLEDNSDLVDNFPLVNPEIPLGVDLSSELSAYNNPRQLKEIIELERESCRLLNSEIQNQIKLNFEKKKNFEEFKLDKLAREVKIKSSPAGGSTHSSFKAECALVFYNMMIVNQSEQLLMRQNGLFHPLYLVKF